MKKQNEIKQVKEKTMKKKKRLLGPAFSSYIGRVHIPYINTKPHIFAGKPIRINTVCGDHVIVDNSDVPGHLSKENQSVESGPLPVGRKILKKGEKVSLKKGEKYGLLE